jgi:hypothetical protein
MAMCSVWGRKIKSSHVLVDTEGKPICNLCRDKQDLALPRP